MTMALPLPPAPTTRTRTGFWPKRSLGSVCSMRISTPLSAHELRERLRKDDECFKWELLALASQATPQPVESAFVTRQSANVGVREGALVKATLPGRNGCNRRAVRASHGAGAYAPIVREI